MLNDQKWIRIRILLLFTKLYRVLTFLTNLGIATVPHDTKLTWIISNDGYGENSIL